MKKSIKFLFICVCFITFKVFALEPEMCEVSEAYLEWSNMSESERNKIKRPEYCKFEDSEEEVEIEVTDKKKSSVVSYPSYYEATSTDVKNQNVTPTCWAFASTTVLESHLLNKKGITYTFSPGHLNYMESQSFYGELNKHAPIRWVNDGGTFFNSSIYYINRYGPVNESDSPTDTTSSPLPPVYLSTIWGKKNVVDVNNIEYTYRSKSGACTAGEIKKIKNNIMNYGPTGADMYINSDYYTSSYTYIYKTNNKNSFANHDVTIIGWNDDYPARRFNGKAQNDGAWIVQNSYGTSFGNNGIFYISYEDDEICTGRFSIKSTDTNFSDNKYITSEQPYYTYSKVTTEMSVFNKKKNGVKEKLNKVSFQVLGPTNYKVYYYKGNAAKKKKSVKKMTLIASGSVDYAGWVTIKPSKSITIPADASNYSIAVVLSNKKIPLNANVRDINDTNLGKVVRYSSPEKFKKGMSYMYYSGKWYDLYNVWKTNNYKTEINAFTDNIILDVTSAKIKYYKDDYFDVIFSIKANYNGKITKIDVVKDGNVITGSPELDYSIEKGKTYTYSIRKEGLTNFKNGTYKVRVYTDNGLTRTREVKINVIPISSVKITNKTGLKLGVNKTLQLNTTISPSNRNSFSSNLTWTSSNESIATVDSNGVVRGVSVGNVTIKATTQNNKTATYDLIIDRPIENIIVNPSEVTLNKGETYSASASVRPYNTTDDKTVTWIASNNRITVSNGLITAISPGKSQITVESSNGIKKYIDVYVTGVSLKEDDITIEIGNQYDSEPLVINASGSASQVVTITSSNPNIVSVSNNRYLNANCLGNAVLTVKDTYGRSNTVNVTVTKIKASNLDVSSISTKTYNGKNIKPSVNISYNGISLKKDKDYTLSYKNNKNPGKATITIKMKSSSPLYEGSRNVYFIIKPKKVSIKSISTKSKAITISYSKLSNISGYQISYRIKGSSNWKSVYVKGTSKKIKGLVKNKTYQIKVRSYKIIDNKKYYGSWSKTKKIKCK